MARQITKNFYCTRGKEKKFTVTFEEQTPNEWTAVKKEIPKQVPILQRLKSKMGLMADSTSTDNGEATVSGVFYDDLPCPYCGQKGFVRCGSCNQFICHQYGESHFKCSYCGNEGEVTGTIEDMSGNVEKGNDPSADSGYRLR